MMLGSTSVADATKEKKRLGGLKKDYLGSQQQGIPVNYFAGRRMFGGQYLSPSYNQITQNISGQTGKDDTGTVAHRYFVDWSLLWCVGGRRPLDAIFKVIKNSDVKWHNDAGLFFAAAEYLNISPLTGGTGTMRIYRGSLTQPVDTLVFTPRGLIPIGTDPRDPSTWPQDLTPGNPNPLSGHYDIHPAYPGSVYSVMDHWNLGKDNPTVPQLQIEAQRGAPWFAGNTYTPTDLDNLGLNSNADGINVVGFVYDIATDTFFGLGLTDAELRRTGFENTLAAFADWRVSPLLTDMSDAKTVFVRALEYIDGFIRDFDGLLDIGYFKHTGIVIDDLPLLTDDDLDGEPDIDDDDFASASTVYQVTYADRDQLYEERSVRAYDPAMFRRLGEQRYDPFDGQWLTSRDQAKRLAAERRRIGRRSKVSGEIPIKREWLDAAPKVGGGSFGQVRIGDVIYFQSARYGYAVALRLMEYELPDQASGRANLTVESERAIGETPYVAPADDTIGDFVIEPVEMVNHHVLELPSGLKTAATPQVAILAQRPRADTIGFNVFGSASGSTYDQVSVGNHCAAWGKIAGANYPNSTADIDTVTGVTVDLIGPDLDRVTDFSGTDAARNDNTLLIVNKRTGEIMSAGQVSALGGGRYNIKTKRRLYGTAKTSQLIDDELFFIFRSELTAIASALFVPGATRYFKLQPYTLDDALDITGVTAITYNFVNAPAVGSVFNVQLTSVAGVAADNTPDIRVVAKFDAVLDQGIFQFEIAWKKAADATWQSSIALADPSGHNAFDFEVTPGTDYSVRITPVNIYGEPGAAVTQAITSSNLSVVSVTGLELTGQANDTVSVQPDFSFSWRLNSPAAAPQLGNTAIVGLPDPLLDAYIVEIYSGTVTPQQIIDQLVQPIYAHETGTVPRFIFRLVDNASCGGGPFAKITCAVRARDKFKNLSAPAVLSVENVAPAAPIDPQLVATLTGITITLTEPADADIEKYELLASTDFNDADPHLVGTIARGQTSGTVNGVTDDSMFFWTRSVDTFGLKSPMVFIGGATPGSPVGAVQVTPPGGNISGATAVQAACSATPNAQIYFRNDDTDPTTADTLFDPLNPPSISATGDMSFVAFLGGVYGPVTHVHFDLVLNGLSTPTFSPGAGSFATDSGQTYKTVMITVPNTPPAGTTIRWRVNGGSWSVISASSGSVQLPVGAQSLDAQAIAPAGYVDSAIGSAAYTITLSGGGGTPPAKVAAIQFIPAGGGPWHLSANYNGRKICFATDTLGAQMRNTVDGSTPTSGSGGHGTASPQSVGSDRIVKSSTRLQAIGYKSGLADSDPFDHTFSADSVVDNRSTCPTPEILVPGLMNGQSSIAFDDLPRTGHTELIGPPGEQELVTYYTRDLYFALACDMAYAQGDQQTRIRWTRDGSDPGGAGGSGTLITTCADWIKISLREDTNTPPLTITIKAKAHDPGGHASTSALLTKTINIT